jgi:hypothetical protein
MTVEPSEFRGERTENLPIIQQALARAIRDALRRHKEAGNPVATWRDGKVEWVRAEDIEVPERG